MATRKQDNSRDIRQCAERSAEIIGSGVGAVYQLQEIVQAWWHSDVLGRAFDSPVSETWTAPDVVQATREFDSMVERWV